jgi:3-phosphoshikimate 1-carboxyvinyltransferase
LTLPGDKSISHRAAIIAALANGTSTLQNFSTSNDCEATLRCLRALGVGAERHENILEIKGVGLRGFEKPLAALDCGNSGSTMRMLAGVLAAQDFTTTLIGDPSLSARPMRRIIEPLELMGAKISSVEQRPPLAITGASELQPLTFQPGIASAQVKSCILFAGLHADGNTTVVERRRTRDHTERLLKFFGVPVTTEQVADSPTRITVSGPAQPLAREFRVPGDISSAAFFLAAASLLKGSELRIDDVGLNPSRTQFMSVFGLLGLTLNHKALIESGGEPCGFISVTADRSSEQPAFQTANRLPADLVPSLIDELPLLAVVGTQVAGGITVRGAGELRFKESDRISATVSNLKAMGAQVREFDDGFAVRGPQPLHGAQLHSYGDHRIAMAFTIAALLAHTDSELDGSEYVAVSFPEFFDLLESIVER